MPPAQPTRTRHEQLEQVRAGFVPGRQVQMVNNVYHRAAVKDRPALPTLISTS